MSDFKKMDREWMEAISDFSEFFKSNNFRAGNFRRNQRDCGKHWSAKRTYSD